MVEHNRDIRTASADRYEGKTERDSRFKAHRNLLLATRTPSQSCVSFIVYELQVFACTHEFI